LGFCNWRYFKGWREVRTQRNRRPPHTSRWKRSKVETNRS